MLVNRGDGIYSSVTGLNIDLKKKNTFNLDGSLITARLNQQKTNGFLLCRLAKTEIQI